MKEIIILFLILYCHLFGLSQTVYYSSVRHLLPNLYENRIGVFDLLSCDTLILFKDTTDISGYVYFGGIAFGANGILYSLTYDGIYEIDLQAQTHTKVLDGPPLPRIWRKGIASTKDSLLIFGERDFFSYDINSQVLTYHGRIPISLSVWANMFWVDGQLMGSANDEIVQIDLNDLNNSSVYCQLPKSGFLSLIQVAVDCDSTALFAFHISGDIFLVNPEDCSTSLYCSLGNDPEETFQGTALGSMYMPPPPCSIYVDLDLYDVTAPGYDYRDTMYCSLPGQFLFSEMDLHSDRPWDSLKVWIESGPPGFTLESPVPPFATLSGQSTSRLKYMVSEPSDLSELAPFLGGLILAGVVPTGVTTITVGFRAWADHTVSDTAYATITLIGRSVSAGDDQQFAFCLHDPPIDLDQMLDAAADPGGYWRPLTQQTGLFNPVADASGIYMYIVPDPVCDADTADYTIDIHPVPDFDLGPDRRICPGDTLTIEIPASSGTILWSDGSIGSSHQVQSQTRLFAELIDPYDCTFRDSVSIIFEEDCILHQIFIPNIFSPEGNGINDVWNIGPSPLILTMQLTIYDRWGNALYYQKGDSIQWSGTDLNGKAVPAGVYVYKLIYTTLNQETGVQTGNITLVR